MAKKYTIKEATRKRCKVLKVSEVNMTEFKQINVELFHFFFTVNRLPFSLYFKADNELVEYMRPEETSAELLEHLQLAASKEFTGVAIMIETKDEQAFQNLLKGVRTKKIDTLLKNAPYLDRKTLELFGDLSSASQMVVRGGLTNEVNGKIQDAATKLVDNLMENRSAIGTLSKMVHADPTLYDHSASVAMISSVIAGQLLKKPFNRKGQELVARAGLYHDVGKTCVPSHILNKPGKFTDDEFEIMKTHTTLGYEELMQAKADGSDIEDLVARVALEHHERFGGNGYPHKKKGRAEDDPENGIHLMTRVVSIADVYSALLMKRVYKPAFDTGQAIKIMSDSYKADYDPDIFLPFLKHVVESLNYYTDKQEKAPKDKGKILVIEDGKIKLSS